ncbi:hypothetical protein Calkro_0646 [Caldicellulosiruptor kronotskyensis 2002]|uniref:Uncharacterized protein n=1 Tax=Caldicellulosiruptor kronotskyensis (strain DSM 18902 / VKM B-2412 / 2002) TaxID=632348 RepID=E4SEQ3_CALK2|nr:hypothetical protein [Caldicellulosiruptor kronotskyensis]ADQ45540.1 hypothetical protein Calkro_0646 [Caldicellulosiruptor kronotskyensis 2002]
MSFLAELKIIKTQELLQDLLKDKALCLWGSSCMGKKLTAISIAKVLEKDYDYKPLYFSVVDDLDYEYYKKNFKAEFSNINMLPTIWREAKDKTQKKIVFVVTRIDRAKKDTILYLSEILHSVNYFNNILLVTMESFHGFAEEFPNMLIFTKAPEQKLLELCSEDLTKNILCLSLGEAVYLTETKRALFLADKLWKSL